MLRFALQRAVAPGFLLLVHRHVDVAVAWSGSRLLLLHGARPILQAEFSRPVSLPKSCP